MGKFSGGMYRANVHGNFPGQMYGEMSWNFPEGNLREILRGNVGEMSGNFFGERWGISRGNLSRREMSWELSGGKFLGNFAGSLRREMSG